MPRRRGVFVRSISVSQLARMFWNNFSHGTIPARCRIDLNGLSRLLLVALNRVMIGASAGIV